MKRGGRDIWNLYFVILYTYDISNLSSKSRYAVACSVHSSHAKIMFQSDLWSSSGMHWRAACKLAYFFGKLVSTLQDYRLTLLTCQNYLKRARHLGIFLVHSKTKETSSSKVHISGEQPGGFMLPLSSAYYKICVQSLTLVLINSIQMSNALYRVYEFTV